MSHFLYALKKIFLYIVAQNLNIVWQVFIQGWFMKFLNSLHLSSLQMADSLSHQVSAFAKIVLSSVMTKQPYFSPVKYQNFSPFMSCLSVTLESFCLFQSFSYLHQILPQQKQKRSNEWPFGLLLDLRNRKPQSCHF